MSLFSSTTMSFVAARNPAFEPPPKPRFFGSASTFTCGKALAHELGAAVGRAVVDDDDFVAGLPAIASMTDGRYFSSRSRPFQLGITTDAPSRRAGVDGACVAPSEELPREIRQRQRGHRHEQHQRREDNRAEAPAGIASETPCHLAGRTGPSPTLRPSFIQRDSRTSANWCADRVRLLSASAAPRRCGRRVLSRC